MIEKPSHKFSLRVACISFCITQICCMPNILSQPLLEAGYTRFGVGKNQNICQASSSKLSSISNIFFYTGIIWATMETKFHINCRKKYTKPSSNYSIVNVILKLSTMSISSPKQPKKCQCPPNDKNSLL